MHRRVVSYFVRECQEEADGMGKGGSKRIALGGVNCFVVAISRFVCVMFLQ